MGAKMRIPGASGDEQTLVKVVTLEIRNLPRGGHAVRLTYRDAETNQTRVRSVLCADWNAVRSTVEAMRGDQVPASS